MKNLALLFFALVALSSCKKDYTCTCKDVNGTPNKIIVHGTNKQARVKCNYYSGVYAGTGTTCSLQ